MQELSQWLGRMRCRPRSQRARIVSQTLAPSNGNTESPLRHSTVSRVVVAVLRHSINLRFLCIGRITRSCFVAYQTYTMHCFDFAWDSDDLAFLTKANVFEFLLQAARCKIHAIFTVRAKILLVVQLATSRFAIKTRTIAKRPMIGDYLRRIRSGWSFFPRPRLTF